MNDIAALIPQRNGDLTCMLVDSQVQNHRDSPSEERGKQLSTELGEPLLFGKNLSFIDIKEAARLSRGLFPVQSHTQRIHDSMP